ncbi:MAG: LexA family transcriptional regulator [Flavobacteriales bacterium]
MNNNLKQIIDFKGITQKEFAEKIGVSQQYINKIITGNVGIGSSILEKIALNYPDINLKWVLGIPGAHMLLDLEKPGGKATYAVDEKCSNRGRPKGRESDAAAEGIAIYRADSPGGIPLIPVEAVVSWGTADFQLPEHKTQSYLVPDFDGSKVDFMIRVKDNSMSPEYRSGDAVACKKLPLHTFFQWNRVYVLDTIQGTMVKRIRKSELESHIECVSDNANYEPFDLRLEEIHALAIVRGVIRFE